MRMDALIDCQRQNLPVTNLGSTEKKVRKKREPMGGKTHTSQRSTGDEPDC